MLRKAATVKEAIKIAGRYQRRNWDRGSSYLSYQVFLADSTGDAIVISAGKDGEMAFTRRKPGEGYLVSTNFNRANPENAWSYPCKRYDKAVEMLAKFHKENDLTGDYFKFISFL